MTLTENRRQLVVTDGNGEVLETVNFTGQTTLNELAEMKRNLRAKYDIAEPVYNFTGSMLAKLQAYVERN